MIQHHINDLVDIKGESLYISYQHQFAGRPTLVFLHDSLGSVQLWRDFPEQLASATQCNILIYDRLGYGKSMPMPTHIRAVDYMLHEADMLNELLAALEIEDAILFGHSDGGSIALLTASRHPKRIKALICEAAHIFVEEVTLKGIREAMEAYKTTDLGERLKKYHGDKVDTLFKAWTETWTRDDFRSWNIEPLLKNIKCPLLFIQGTDDEYGTMDQVDKTIAQVSGTAIKFAVPDAKHTPHKENTTAVLKQATDFILKYGGSEQSR